ncbi:MULTISPECIES: S41 family peptidase [Chitinophagaceae]
MKKIINLLFYIVTITANAQQNSVPSKLTLLERNEVIDTLINRLNALYVYEDVAKKMSTAIRLHQQQHDYDTVTDRQVFAAMLTKDLQAISKDGHLGVEASATPVINETPGSPSQDDINKFRLEWSRHNFNFKKVEHLDGNIGLLELNTFFPADWIKEIAAGSFAFLSNSDAIIIDLRNNHGFAPDGVNLIESYFFKDETHMSDIYDKDAKTLRQYWTMATVPGVSLANKDLYVLVSKNTFSAPESFAYDMQAVGRAKIIGEVTGGGAHGTKPVTIGKYFIASIPFSYEVNPVTHTDWEGKGVQPDVKVPAEQALLTAQIMAIRSVINHNSDDADRIKNQEQVILQLQQQLDALKEKH